MLRYIAFLLIIFLRVSFAQPQPGDDSQQNRVTGSVVESKSGTPIRKALVVLHRDANSGVGAVTDSEGKFAFRDLEPGAYSLSVEKEGWVAARESRNVTATVAKGQSTPAITLKLVKTAVISGRVVDADGDPIPGVSIQVTADPVGKTGPQGAGASTNDRGEYRAYNVPPGQYKICAAYVNRSQQMNVQMQGGIPAYPTVCFPGTSRGNPVTVEPGVDLQGIDFQIVPARAVKVSGRVVSHVEQQPPLVVVSLQPADGVRGFAAAPDTVVRDAGGKFELQGVLPGRYRLTVSGFSLDGASKFGASKLIEVADADLNGVDVIVSPPRKIEGRLILPEGRKAPQLIVALTPRDPGDHQGGGMAQVSPAGTFRFAEVGGDVYDVALASTGPADDLYVSAIRLGDSDALADGVKADASGTMEIVLKAHGGTLACSVTNEKDEPVPAAHVLLLPDPPRERQLALHGECQTNATGSCEILGIAPGEYHVYAFPKDSVIDVRDANALKLYEKYGKAVKLAEGEHRELPLKFVSVE